MISRIDMLDKLRDYHDKIYNHIMTSDIPDKEIFDEMCCSPYSGDEWTDFKVINECDTFGVHEFTYKGFIFKITAVVNEERFVCWIEQREDKSYLENAYLVPGAWIWGKSIDKNDVKTIFLPAIDDYLHELGEDNIQ